jgi:hypothetical protein
MTDREPLEAAAEFKDMTMNDINLGWVVHGGKFPYDGGSEFWQRGRVPKPPTDWAHAAARGVLANLCDRRGVKHELRNVDHDVREEIAQTLAGIIRAAALKSAEFAEIDAADKRFPLE